MGGGGGGAYEALRITLLSLVSIKSSPVFVLLFVLCFQFEFIAADVNFRARARVCEYVCVLAIQKPAEPILHAL